MKIGTFVTPDALVNVRINFVFSAPLCFTVLSLYWTSRWMAGQDPISGLLRWPSDMNIL